jgi:hypothetical protein
LKFSLQGLFILKLKVERERVVNKDSKVFARFLYSDAMEVFVTMLWDATIRAGNKNCGFAKVYLKVASCAPIVSKLNRVLMISLPVADDEDVIGVSQGFPLRCTLVI